MEFKRGAHVSTSDGKTVGTIDRVVLAPQSDEMADLIIRKRWSFGEDKVLPVVMIDSATEDRITLSKNEADLPKLTKFKELYSVPTVRKGCSTSI